MNRRRFLFPIGFLLFSLGISVLLSTVSRAAPSPDALLPSDTAEVHFRVMGAKELARLVDGSRETVVTVEAGRELTVYLVPDREAVLSGVILKDFFGVAGVTLAISGDGVNWREIVSERKVTAGKNEISFDPVSARMVKLTMKAGKEAVSVAEVAFLFPEQGTVDVKDVRFEDISEHSATVRWRTTLPEKTSLLYGLSTVELTTTSTPQADFSTEHHVTLTGLYPGTEYFVWILAGGRSHGKSVEEPYTFRTAGDPYPIPTNIRVSTGIGTAVISFGTNVEATGKVLLEDVRTGQVREWETEKGREHSVAIGNLRPRSFYRYTLKVRDRRGRTTTYPPGKFRTRSFNIARGAPVIGSFRQLLPDQMTEDTRPALKRITDGRYDYFRGMATSGDLTDTYQWVQVDLGRTQEIESVETIWRGNAYPTNFALMVSENGKDWSYPGFSLNAFAGLSERSERGDPLLRLEVPVGGKKVRFVKIFIPKGRNYYTRSPSWRFVQLSEIEVNGVWKGTELEARGGGEEEEGN